MSNRCTTVVFVSLMLMWTGLFASPVATADVVWLIGDPNPRFGLVTESNEQVVRLNQSVDGVRFEAVEFQRAKVASWVVNVDFERLESLSIERVSEYRDYAEELTPQTIDPVARRLAIRLLVIVAGNSDNEKMRNAAIATLVRLAKSEEERRRWRLLEFLETGTNHAPTVKESKQELSQTSAAERKELAALIQALRRGEKRSLAGVDPSIRKTAEVWQEICSWEELEQMAKVNLLRDEQLRRLLDLEYEIRRVDQAAAADIENGVGIANGDQANSRPSNTIQLPWSELALRAEGGLEIPTVANATEFDPRESIFRNGSWKRPAGDPKSE